MKIRTRQFAKRQLTWFRRQMRLNWAFDGRGNRRAARLAAAGGVALGLDSPLRKPMKC